MRDYTYQNKKNPNKFIQIRRYADGHFVWKQYIRHFVNTFFECRNYTGCSLKQVTKGVWHRINKVTMLSVLEDYTLVEAL